MRTSIVASLPVYNIGDLEKIKRIDADFIELRLDYMDKLEVNLDSLNEYRSKLIFTIRDKSEGGYKEIPDAEKSAFLKELYSKGFLYDIEASFLQRELVPHKGKIVSAHYFDHIPSFEELEDIIRKYREAYIIKFALVGKENYREILIKLLRYENIAVMPMNVDPLERIAFSILGSKLIYGYVDIPTASGQMHYKDIKRIFQLLANY
ncbi:type I 3-dehydroquinate dehydratase [Acidianus brierleyi]|uniref:3-dehydroquinate dehydratase n=1 Tax=Acidianus brierleyi TaxID=41673 RepID=A0A2U9IFW5_9CREN|nr:type I 3-dehydroquinate dehydratase [Acidianus brierleyi]AWR94845.1 type I 3-dehydroquinate dehydratase [Acidianus brierleyi]